MPMFSFSKVVSEVEVLVEGITRSGSSYGTFLLDLVMGLQLMVLVTLFVQWFIFISLIDCTLKRIYPL
jgi:hypothetical protein